MANLVFDFLHNYKTGERRESDPADAYQYDEGHVFEAVVPVAVTSCEIHYWARGFDEAEAYTPASITHNTDNSYTITGNIPNKFFETYGDLRVYIVVTDGDASITTYEGRIHICERSKPDDYVDDDPDNEATRVLVEARAAAQTATAAAQTAQDAADSIPADYTQLSGDVSALKEDLTAETEARETADEEINAALENKANIDGYYEDMTVGDAEQLVASQYAEDSVPYNFRTTGGSADVGNREYVDAVVGGSIVWNSLARFNQSDIPSASNGITYTYTDGDSVLINGTATANEVRTGWFGLSETAGFDLARLNHKMLIYPKLISGTVEGSVSFLLPSNTLTALDTAKIGVLAYSSTNQIRCIHYIANGTVCTNAKITIICVDLTAMFGSQITDYAYSLETATAGAGIAWLKQRFPKIFDSGYIPYNPRELVSVAGVSEKRNTGFNQWDEEWEVGTIDAEGNNAYSTSNIRSKNYIHCLPNTSYYGKFTTVTGASSLFFYDGDEKFLSRTFFTHEFDFVTPESAKFMRFAMGSSYGTTYKNDICINLSWSGWRNGEYEAYQKHSYPLDDSLTLRGIPKLDAQNNLYYDGDEYLPDGTVTRNYTVRAYQEGDESLADAITDGTNTVVKLATPTTETAEPYQHIQICDDFGTEEYVSTSIVPVGHNTRYPANLRDKLQHLPDLADDDGYYMIGQSNKQMRLELFRIPKAPTSPDGTYVLKATVSGGTPTYTWEAQT